MQPYMIRVLFQSASWLDLLITYDRLRSIQLSIGPARNLHNLNKHHTYKILALFALFILLINTPNFGFYLMTKKSMNQTAAAMYLPRMCQPIHPVLAITRDVISQLMRVILPFTLSIVMNIMLMRALVASKKRANISRNMSKEYSYGVTIFALNILFLFTHLPLGIATLMHTIKRNFSSNFRKEIDVIYFASIITLYVVSFYYSLTFWINLKFNKVFYNESRLAWRQFKLNFCYFCCWWCCKFKTTNTDNNANNNLSIASITQNNDNNMIVLI